MRGDSHAFYKNLKIIYGPTQSKTMSQVFKKKNGTLTKSIQESLERLREYYSELLNRDIVISPKVEEYIEKLRRPTAWELDFIPTQDEFFQAVKRAKKHKSGTDVISVELLQYANSQFLVPAVYQIITRIWETLEIPQSFLDLTLCSIFKKGDKTLCKNQRGISLISYVSKVLTLLINSRMYSYCEKIAILPESQCGFREKRSTVDMIFTAKLLQQSCREKQVPLYMAFLDITKAYDSVDRQTLWKILEAIGIPPQNSWYNQTALWRNKISNQAEWKAFRTLCGQTGVKTGLPSCLSIVQYLLRNNHSYCSWKASEKGS